MRQRNILAVATLLLLWLPQLLLAQQAEDDPFLKMKPGDWFEVRAELRAQLPNLQYVYDMKYYLTRVLDNGNRDYRLTFERTKIRFSEPKTGILAYDSYYPPYLQNSLEHSKKPGFQLQVSKAGKIVKLLPDPDFPTAKLTAATWRQGETVTTVETSLVEVDSAKKIATTINYVIARQDKQFLKGHLITDSDLTILLAKASFPLKENALVKGNIHNYNPAAQQKTALFSDLGGPYTIAKDGSFIIPLSIKEGAVVRLYTDDKANGLTLSWFVKPGDTLSINADRNSLEESIRFSGRGSKAAELGTQLGILEKKITIETKAFNEKSFSAVEFMKDQQQQGAAIERVLSRYKGQVPEESWNYYKQMYAYKQAGKKLKFLLMSKYLSTPKSAYVFQEFPKDFFVSIDTLSVKMIDQTGADWYRYYLNYFSLYQSRKVRASGGESFGFMAGYSMSLTYLKRFPLYHAMFRQFRSQMLEQNWKGVQSLNPYYEEFIRNCGDTAMTTPLKQQWKTINSWVPGQTIPVSEIELDNGKKLQLQQFKGKALSITFNHQNPDEIKFLVELIKKQDPKKVHFVIVQLVEEHLQKSSIKNIFKSFSNVTYLELSEFDEDKNKPFLMKSWDTKTFLFDRNLNIVEDNIRDTHPEHIIYSEALERALKSPAPKPENKVELIRTIGWSASSILVSFLIGFWIYKIRMASLKKRELVKRQIQELEIRAIRSQMNPHFMFNALNSIQYLINHQHYEKANIYLQKFALLMCRVLNNSERTFVALSDELEAVELYCELEQLRFDFTFTIHVHPEVNASLIEIPGMIIQPLVENSILHGLAQKGDAGALQINILLEQSCLRIEVTDNGPGLKKDSGDKVQQGFGLKLVRERLDLLNTHGNKGNLIISSTLEGNATGTSAVLTIPID